MINSHYDQKNDVMYISLSNPRPSYSEELDDGIYLRYDMETDEFTGITIIGFSKRIDQLKFIKMPCYIPFDEIKQKWLQ